MSRYRKNNLETIASAHFRNNNSLEWGGATDKVNERYLKSLKMTGCGKDNL